MWADRRGSVAARVAAHAALALAVVVTCAPLVWMASTSLETPEAVFARPLLPLPWPPTAANFAAVLAGADVPRQLLNSLVVAAGVTVGQLVIALPAAYVFARRPFSGSGALFSCVLVTLPIPFVVLYLPNYVLVARTGLLDSYAGLILPQLAGAYAVFLLRQRIAGIPQALIDAARLDGAGEWTILWRIVLPVCRAAVAALAIFVFITAWNEYVWPSLVAPDPSMRVLTVGVAQFAGGEGGTRWGPTMAAAVLACLPTGIAYLVFRRHVLAAVMEGATKG
jgi:ABC-type glycerol-3-phosphate transport system permease component